MKHLSRMRRNALDIPAFLRNLDSHCLAFLLRRLMVISDLYIVRPVRLPDKADAVLVINPDAVLTLAITFERF
jgi:hypothetical protein